MSKPSIVYLYGYRTLIAVFLGAFAANSLEGELLPSLLISVGNTGEALIGAIVVRSVLSYRNQLSHQTETIAFAAASALGSLCSASIGVFALYRLNSLPAELLSSVWITWWIGDMLGGLVVSPVIIK